ncbi:hypothetical protein AAZX31_11G164600 [Glycine max]
MALSGMRGLSVFVSDIRNCQNKEQVRLRVDKELGNIRKRFKTEKVSEYILGEFGHLLVRQPGCSPKDFYHSYSSLKIC